MRARTTNADSEGVVEQRPAAQVLVLVYLAGGETALENPVGLAAGPGER
jgi:hypothetical protein